MYQILPKFQKQKNSYAKCGSVIIFLRFLVSNIGKHDDIFVLIIFLVDREVFLSYL